MREYATLLAAPGLARIVASQLFARVPIGMLGLAVLIHLEDTSGSYAIAGLTVGFVSLGECVGIPLSSRLTARLGSGPVLVTCAAINALAVLALAYAPNVPLLLLGLGLCVGASVPPLMPVIRALYPALVPPDGLRAMFALDTAAQELIWVSGPVLVTALVAVGSTEVPLVATAVLTLVGTFLFVINPRVNTVSDRMALPTFGRVLLRREVWLGAVVCLLVVTAYTALEVALVVTFQGGVEVGFALAVACIGSLVGGLAFGHRAASRTRLTVALVVMAAGTAVSWPLAGQWLAYPALFVSGLGFAPALSWLYASISSSVPPRQSSEAFAWLNSGTLLGAALGTALAGLLGDVGGASSAFLLATVAACLAIVTPAGFAVTSFSPRANEEESPFLGTTAKHRR